MSNAAPRDSDLYDELNEWLQVIREAELPAPPSLAIAKAEELKNKRGITRRGVLRFF